MVHGSWAQGAREGARRSGTGSEQDRRPRIQADVVEHVRGPGPHQLIRQRKIVLAFQTRLRIGSGESRAATSGRYIERHRAGREGAVHLVEVLLGATVHCVHPRRVDEVFDLEAQRKTTAELQPESRADVAGELSPG